MMMRAALILGGLCVLTAMEIATPRRSDTVAVAPPASSLPQAGADSRDTLTKADRLEIAHMIYDAPVRQVSLTEAAPSVAATVNSPEAAKGAEPRAAKAAVVLPRPKPKPAEPKLADAKPSEPKSAEPRRIEPKHPEPKHVEAARTAKPDRPKPAAEARSCQYNAFAGLLKALSLGCDT